VNAGNFTVSDTSASPDITAGTSTVSLAASGTNAVLTISGSVTGNGGVTYTADQMTLTGATTASSGIATLRPSSAAQLINIGGADSAGTLGLTNYSAFVFIGRDDYTERLGNYHRDKSHLYECGFCDVERSQQRIESGRKYHGVD
jgi:hypothetical protein